MSKKIVRYVNKEYKGPAVREKVVSMYREFCPYIKYEERGKLNKRAIVSANIIMRMFLLITEEFHLALGKKITGSTISIGGEDKKLKIITNLSSLSIPADRPVYLQKTEDASKFNECLSPQIFALMHNVFFSEEVRAELGLPPPTEMEKLFSSIAITGNFFIALKRVKLGNCMIFESEYSFNRPEWTVNLVDRMTERTAEWYTKIMRFLEKGDFVRASPGMLMGMYNAASTTLGLTAVGYRSLYPRANMVTLLSNDDSMTRFVGEDAQAFSGSWYKLRSSSES